MQRKIRIGPKKNKCDGPVKNVLNAAASLFSRKGYLETTIDEIAVAAGITKGGIYYYFDSKADILYSICSSYIDNDIDVLEQIVDSISSYEDKLRYIVKNHITHYSRQQNFAKTLLHESYNLPKSLLQEIKKKERKYYEMVLNIINGILGENVERELATAVTFSLFAMMNWIYKWYNPRGSLKPDKLSEIVFNLFMNGVGSLAMTSRFMKPDT
ncbi:MAG: TetR/AcrR family transcriptional regulator [Deltaproteobacteria bacterium]|nr:TetR/AcrR family transcriptional regulator [Deltaproteobacteria bacterium]